LKILLAPDSFKDALPALAVCKAMERGIRLAAPEVEIRLFPMADGGEGTSEVLAFHRNGITKTCIVHDPLHRPIETNYLLSADGKWAYIEMAKASGLELLLPEERNPLETSTFGTGELIADAIYNKGVKHLILGIGGSATNDGGTGMATALGWRFYDSKGKEVHPCGKNLSKIASIHPPISPLPGDLRVETLCDVDNLLFGERGAAYVYAPQKGATAEAVVELDEGLQHLSVLLQKTFGKDFSNLPGAGAAGGMGAGTMAFLGATLRPGIAAMIELTGFEKAVQDADLVITGEGRLDNQTMHGKLVLGITRLAAKHGVPVIALCGSLDATPSDIEKLGLLAAFSISPRPQTLEAALAATALNLELTAWNVMRLIVRIPKSGLRDSRVERQNLIVNFSNSFFRALIFGFCLILRRKRNEYVNW
jgi:glycerate kinase